MTDFWDVPEAMLDQPVCTWEPQVGDRVRIWVNPECDGEPEGPYDGTHDPHIVNGCTGRVIPRMEGVEYRPEYRHIVNVAFDKPWCRAISAHYAAAELELITPAS